MGPVSISHPLDGRLHEGGAGSDLLPVHLSISPSHGLEEVQQGRQFYSAAFLKFRHGYSRRYKQIGFIYWWMSRSLRWLSLIHTIY